MPLIERDCDVIYKVLIVGDSGVGKTAILDCLMGRDFNENSRPTVGVDFVRRIVEADGALVQLRIWDTAGLEKFRSITRLQYRGVQGLIIVYDVTDESSFKSVEYWLSSIQQIRSPYRHPYEPLPFIVVGNKCDVISQKKVSLRQGSKLAKKEMAFGFYEISAKTGTNVYKAFRSLAYHITDITHPKLMKSYHPNFIRPVGVRPETSKDAHRLSAPCFSSSSSTLSSHTTPSARHRYSLWDPLIPWNSYTPPSAQKPPGKKKVKRLKFTVSIFKNKKRKNFSKINDEPCFGSSSRLNTGVAGQRGEHFGSKRKKSRKFSLRGLKNVVVPKKRSKRDKNRDRKVQGKTTRYIGLSLRKSFKTQKSKDEIVKRSKTNLRAKTIKTRILHCLFSCFLKQKVD